MSIDPKVAPGRGAAGRTPAWPPQEARQPTCADGLRAPGVRGERGRSGRAPPQARKPPLALRPHTPATVATSRSSRCVASAPSRLARWSTATQPRARRTADHAVTEEVNPVEVGVGVEAQECMPEVAEIVPQRVNAGKPAHDPRHPQIDGQRKPVHLHEERDDECGNAVRGPPFTLRLLTHEAEGKHENDGGVHEDDGPQGRERGFRLAAAPRAATPTDPTGGRVAPTGGKAR